MPTIEAKTFIGRGWKEHYSGFPADLFFADAKTESPWEVKPHLHVNYSMMGNQLQSLTYKNATGTNTYLFLNGNWGLESLTMIDSEKVKAEVEYLRNIY